VDFGVALFVLILVLFCLLFSGVWIGISLGITGVLGLMLFTRFPAGDVLSLVAWDCTSVATYTAVPMFIFMGNILYSSRTSEMLFMGLSTWFDRIPGKLLHSNVIACSMFAAVSGSSVATTATIGRFTLPEFEKRGYDPGLSIGSLAGAGTVGFLIPPSLIMIVYGVLVNESVGMLFIAGIIPGILLSAIFMSYIALRAIINPKVAPGITRHTWKEKFASARYLAPTFALILIVLGGIYLGWTTPTEAAVIGALCSVIISLINGTFSWQVLKDSLIGTLDTTCMVMLIVVGASVFSTTLGYLRAPARLAEAITTWGLSPYAVLAILGLFYLLLGCFFDGFSMLVMTLPITYPVMMGLGFNSLWYGIFLVIMIEAAQVTPPVGFNLFVIQNVCGRDLNFIIRACLPFVLLMFLEIIILAVWPEIVLWLPSKMK